MSGEASGKIAANLPLLQDNDPNVTWQTLPPSASIKA